MKKLAVIMGLLVAVLLASSVQAVEVQESKKPPKQRPAQVQKPDRSGINSTNQEDSSVGRAPGKTTKPAKKDFDNFIDRNNNGIDDRAEQKHEKSNPERDKIEKRKKNPSDSL